MLKRHRNFVLNYILLSQFSYHGPHPREHQFTKSWRGRELSHNSWETEELQALHQGQFCIQVGQGHWKCEVHCLQASFLPCPLHHQEQLSYYNWRQSQLQEWGSFCGIVDRSCLPRPDEALCRKRRHFLQGLYFLFNLRSFLIKCVSFLSYRRYIFKYFAMVISFFNGTEQRSDFAENF